MDEIEKRGQQVTGIIPDFFHDVIAYLIPGYTLLFIMFLNTYVAKSESLFTEKEIGIFYFFVITVIAYVIGRFLEHLGYWSIHHKTLLRKDVHPKWSLVFDDSQTKYTEAFRKNLKEKIETFLKNQDGENLITQCKENKKDDYFNLIQFYLRERFPSVAVYEKKQNATIVLTRSLAIGFLLNIFIYFLTVYLLVDQAEFSIKALIWVATNIIFSYIFYLRFRLDQKYHAMYIFEAFIATKKLLKKTPKDMDKKQSIELKIN
jgi:hypothetical protein